VAYNCEQARDELGGGARNVCLYSFLGTCHSTFMVKFQMIYLTEDQFF